MDPIKTCRTPHGVRGLKLGWTRPSAPPRRRTPRGVRGLKFAGCLRLGDHAVGRTPHGVRGLKSRTPVRAAKTRRSHPSRGAWIEIGRSSTNGAA